MLVTKHAAELCAHVVNDMLGELPARVLTVLFGKGRLTHAQLVHHTSLPPREVRHGLAVLIQQNLLYHYSSRESPVTNYEANPDACYNLLRSGKVVEMVGNEYGPAEQEVVKTLLQLGHARVSDLVQAFGYSEGGENGTNGYHVNGGGRPGASPSRHVQSAEELYIVLCRLIIGGVIDQVGPKTFRSPDDMLREIQDDTMKTATGEKTSAKAKAALQQVAMARFRTACDESQKLKRQLEHTVPFTAKRRRMANGTHSNGSLGGKRYSEAIPPNCVLKINFEKCLVDLRNQTLARYASESLGMITGQVYHTTLRLLSDKLARCRENPRVDAELDVNGSADDDYDDESGGHKSNQSIIVTSTQIFDALDPSLNIAAGIGKVPRDKIHFRSAEKVRKEPKYSSLDSDESEGEDIRQQMPRRHGEEDSDMEDMRSPARRHRRLEGDDAKVTFDDGVDAKDNRFENMRQHLLLLAESQEGFLRHCGTQGRGQWTVDFKPLLDRLGQMESEAIIEQTFGRHGLRLTRILRSKGKLDEKTLPSLALMKKQDVQGKMLALQMAGFVDVQEVPRDNSRTANRTMFFWFFDESRVRNQLLDDMYKTMLRCLQTLDVQRYRERNILSFVDRKDVKGKEEEVMTTEHYNKYNRFLELQSKLLGHVMRLDDLVSVFKDF
ncbi:RNA polymerase III subunit RPC82 [Sodiomyces alkalinus F11]|uniref:DNA-directed RNA polymerase III subunit RPC3 n=1 Tax=Sodiomyces alkalinus (strain CBS 110278 / VKM F-3762 / F11) TaxID=1314773 RepID=A0A3N2Q9C9_SODAK|nr:RNA polymerase III subunit RPC82 [Sodiomyces alkalinus F11]ROT43369.1 RNA polymerase III subunit RPC82 [Sodiomyces alkalinus F11]